MNNQWGIARVTNNNQTWPMGLFSLPFDALVDLSCFQWQSRVFFCWGQAKTKFNSICCRVQHHLLPLQSPPVLNKFKQSPNRNYFWISDIDIHSREKKESCLSGTIMKFNLCLIQKLHVKDICRIIMGSSGDRIGSDDGLNGLADLAPSFVPPFFPFQRSFFPSD